MALAISMAFFACSGVNDNTTNCTCGKCPATDSSSDSGTDRSTYSRTDSRNYSRPEDAGARLYREATATSDEEVFMAVEQMPEFPGGEIKLLDVIQTSINYPISAAENHIQSRVVVKFVVKKDGSVGDVIVLRGKDPDLDKEAVRVVKSLPKFIPGKMNGQPVAVWYTVPVNFKLQMM